MTPQKLQLVLLADPAALAERACAEVLQRAAAAIAARGAFRIALSGGSTPRLLYERMARVAGDFTHWHVFFGDERCVPPQHADSNFRMASEAWLARGSVPQAQVHRIRGEDAASQAADAYEHELAAAFGTREVPRFDVVLLGLGPDGHTASLFPGSSALGESHRVVAATWVAQLGVERVTLTARTLNAARCALFLVAGADKATMLRRVLHGSDGADAPPAQRIRPWEGDLLWLVDRAAAAELGRD